MNSRVMVVRFAGGKRPSSRTSNAFLTLAAAVCVYKRASGSSIEYFFEWPCAQSPKEYTREGQQ